MHDFISKKTLAIYLDAEAVYIMKTGWDDYHVITEHGDLNQSTYERMTMGEIIKKYEIDVFTFIKNFKSNLITNDTGITN